VENVIRMHRTGHKGKLPPVVERASSGGAGHGGDGSEMPTGGKDFGSKIKGRSGKSWSRSAQPIARRVGGLLEKCKSLGEVPRRLGGSGSQQTLNVER